MASGATGDTATVDGTGSTGVGDDASTGEEPTGTETGGAICVPPEPGIVATFTIEPDVPISAGCIVLGTFFEPTEGLGIVDLECGLEPYTVTTQTAWWGLQPHLFEGNAVGLDYVTDPIFWTNRWFALRDAEGSGRLIAGGFEGSALDPPGTTLDAFLGGTRGEPLVSEVAGLCEPEASVCGDEERVGLGLGLLDGMATTVVPDQGQGFVDVLSHRYSMIVQTAIRNLRPVQCDDLPPAWYQALLFYSPSD